MKYKMVLIFICLIIYLFSMGSVVASDVNETIIVENDNILGTNHNNFVNASDESLDVNDENVLSLINQKDSIIDYYNVGYDLDDLNNSSDSVLGLSEELYTIDGWTFYDGSPNHGFKYENGVLKVKFNDNVITFDNLEGNRVTASKFNQYQLPSTFVLDNKIFNLVEPYDCPFEWYYSVTPIHQGSSKSYTIILHGSFDSNGSLRGCDGDEFIIVAEVISSDGKPAEGHVVFEHFTKSDPVYLLNGNAHYTLKLRYTGPNGGLLQVSFYEGSSGQCKANANVKVYGEPTYLDLSCSDVYVPWGTDYVNLTVNVTNRNNPWRYVDGQVTTGTYGQISYHYATDEWEYGWRWSDKDYNLVWDKNNYVASVNIPIYVKNYDIGVKSIRVVYDPNGHNTYKCKDIDPKIYIVHPIKLINKEIYRKGHNIVVNISMVDLNRKPIPSGEVEINVPLINKSFIFNVTDGKICFSFPQIDYFLNETTIFYFTYRTADKTTYSNHYEEIPFKDDIYCSDIDLNISNLNYGYYDFLTPFVNVDIQSNSSFEKQGYVSLIIGGKRYNKTVENNISKFDVQHYLNVGEYNVVFEYYYDCFHPCLASKNATITVSNNTNVDFCILNDWICGDSLKPIIKVIDSVSNNTYEGFLAHLITTSEISDYKNGKPIYKIVYEQRKLVNGCAVFEFDNIVGSYSEEFIFYQTSPDISVKKRVNFQSQRRTIELIGPNEINLTIGDNIMFNISIKDFDKLLNMFPFMNNNAYKPKITVNHQAFRINEISKDINKGIFTFNYCPESNTNFLDFGIESNYVQGNLLIPCNITRIDPIIEIVNNGTVDLFSEYFGIRFVNGYSLSANPILKTKEYGILLAKNYINDTIYYKMPFNTTGVKNIELNFVPTFRSPFNELVMNFTLNVTKSNANFSFGNYSGKFGQILPITIETFNRIDIFPTGNVILSFNGVEYRAKINNNLIKANIQLPNKSGIYDVTFKYMGDNNFNPFYSVFKVIVDKQNIDLKSEDTIEVKPNQNIKLKIVAISKLVNEININQVDVNLGGNVIKCLIVDSLINFTMPSIIDFDAIQIFYSGDENYNAASKTIKIINTQLNVNINSSFDKNKLTLTFNLSKNVDVDANLILDDKIIPVKFINGHASTIINYPNVGNHFLQIQILDSIYSGFISTTITVPNYGIRTILSEYQIGGYYGNGIYSIKLTDAKGNPISNKCINLIVNGNEDNIYTDDDGIASLFIENMDAYNIIANFKGDKDYLASNNLNSVFEIKSTIECSDVVAPYNYVGLKYKVTFLDKFGNPLKNKKIRFYVRGEYYHTGLTNDKGIAKITCNAFMGAKNYVVELYNYETGETKYQNVKLVKMISGDKDISAPYNSNTYYKLRITDINGKTVGAGEIVNITINKHTYPILTDSNGYATFKINEKPGTYTILASYGNAYVYNDIIVTKATPKITAKAKTFKKSDKTKKYTVTLKTNKNKVMKNTKLTLKVNGKTYSAKTNTKGQATFKLTKLTKKGKFTAIIKYAGSKYYNAKTVKPKITVK